MSAHAKAEDDRPNLDDIRTAVQSLEIAEVALRKAMEGRGQDERDQFVFQVGFAIGRLSRVRERIYGGTNAP